MELIRLVLSYPDNLYKREIYLNIKSYMGD